MILTDSTHRFGTKILWKKLSCMFSCTRCFCVDERFPAAQNMIKRNKREV